MTKIPWTDVTWNPVVGCTKIAAGCKNCYAERMAWRLLSHSLSYQDVVNAAGWTGKVNCLEHRLEQPLRWKRNPRMIFVCSMSDLFHPSVPFDYIDKVMAVIGETKHIYQILTKRPERMKRYFSEEGRRLSKTLEYVRKRRKNKKLLWARRWPWSNIWLGTSISTQADADKNIPILLKIPAAVRFVSIEPMLERIDLHKWDVIDGDQTYFLDVIDWAIIGCESGPGARFCSIEDIRDAVQQCREAGVPVFVKQVPVGGKCSKNPEDWPKDLRIQEYPK